MSASSSPHKATGWNAAIPHTNKLARSTAIAYEANFGFNVLRIRADEGRELKGACRRRAEMLQGCPQHQHPSTATGPHRGATVLQNAMRCALCQNGFRHMFLIGTTKEEHLDRVADIASYRLRHGGASRLLLVPFGVAAHFKVDGLTRALAHGAGAA